MQTIPTTQDLLFRMYLSNSNLKLLHHFITTGDEDYTTDAWRKAAFATTGQDFESRIRSARDKTAQALELCTRENTRILTCLEPAYPPPLLAIKDYPPLLFVKGPLPSFRGAAVVGSREISPLARPKTTFIVKTLVEQGFGIVSGLAMGIDTLAHEAALYHRGYTVAVLPTPLHQVYPLDNEKLAMEILHQGGTLLSEQPPFASPVANPFVLRNRLQAALSESILPVEMSTDSGTAHTLRFAYRYQKAMVLCLPGTLEIDHYLPQYEGILQSIKKYKGKEAARVLLLKDWSELKALLTKRPHANQGALF